jgi:hypothetical protein
VVDLDLVLGTLGEELDRVLADGGSQGHYEDAAKLVEALVTAEEIPEFLTLGAYEQLD